MSNPLILVPSIPATESTPINQVGGSFTDDANIYIQIPREDVGCYNIWPSTDIIQFESDPFSSVVATDSSYHDKTVCIVPSDDSTYLVTPLYDSWSSSLVRYWLSWYLSRQDSLFTYWVPATIPTSGDTLEVSLQKIVEIMSGNRTIITWQQLYNVSVFPSDINYNPVYVSLFTFVAMFSTLLFLYHKSRWTLKL
jgi:hypothetical protein